MVKVEIKYRLSKCDKDTYFYDLYINDSWLCGFYSFEVIKYRLKRYLEKGY